MDSLLYYLSNVLHKSIDNKDLSVEKIYNSFINYSSHSDISSNVLFFLSKQNKTNIKPVADKLVEKLKQSNYIDKVEIENNYINIYLTKDTIQKFLLKTKEKKSFIQNLKNTLFGNKITIEHTDPNFFKELHIGHFMSNTIGDSLVRLKREMGDDVKVINYPSDVGMQAAQTIWAIKNSTEPITINNLSSMYKKGREIYEKDKKIAEEIKTINEQIYNKENDEINKIYNESFNINKKYLEKIYKTLGSCFDVFIYESKAAKIGQKVVEKYIGSVFTKENKAIIYKGEKDGLHTRVFINQNNIPTYETKEIGLALEKNRIFPNRKHFIITASEIEEYMKVVYKAISKINKKIADNTTHITHGFLLFSGKKMSSRKSNTLTLEELIDEMKVAVKEVSKKNNSNLSESDITKIALGAFRFNVLKQSIGKNISFDIDSVVSFIGDTGPYLQYSMVRADKLLKLSEPSNNPYFERKLSMLLIEFEDVLYSAYKDNAPNKIAQHLLKVAHEWNNFYEREKIQGEKDEADKLALVKCVYNVLKKGCSILGIEKVEKM